MRGDQPVVLAAVWMVSAAMPANISKSVSRFSSRPRGGYNDLEPNSHDDDQWTLGSALGAECHHVANRGGGRLRRKPGHFAISPHRRVRFSVRLRSVLARGQQ